MISAATLLRPDTAQAVRDVVAAAAATRTPVELRGAGTKGGVGALAPAPVTLELTALAGIVEYQPDELVLTARAGTRVAEIEAVLEQGGQMLAFEPADHGATMGGAPGRTTIGGVLAAAVSGPRRLKDGAARDHFIGFEAASGRGELFRAGGKVVKNVTGFDLPKLLAGSWGTLAVLTEVTLKVVPRPRTAATLVVEGLDDGDAARAMSLAVGAPVDVSGAAHLPAWATAGCPADLAAGSPATLLRLEGFGPSVEARRDFLSARLGSLGPLRVLDGPQTTSLWRHLRDLGPMQGDARPLWRVCVPPMNGAAAMHAISAQLDVRAYYDWAGGLAWLSVAAAPGTGSDAVAGILQREAARAGGHATLVRAGSGHCPKTAQHAPLAPGVLSLMRQVKAAFDPLGILNPGRLFPEVAA